MTPDKNSDQDIDPERRTAIKTMGFFGTALTGILRKSEDAFGPPAHAKDPLQEKWQSDRGHGHGKWCRSRGKGKDCDQGEGYDRDHPHFENDPQWRDDKEWWEKDEKEPPKKPEPKEDCPDEDPEREPDEDPFQDPEQEPDEDPEQELDNPFQDPEEDLDEDPEQEPDEDPLQDPEQEPDEDPEQEPDEEDETDTPGDVVTRIEMQIHAEVNEYRQANDLDPLTFDEELATVARNHSQDMNDRQYLSHQSPEGDGPGERLADAGISCDSWAENIAFEYDPSFSEEDAESVAESIVDGWIDSPGHRQNLLGNYDEQGIGVDIRDDGQVRATQMFCSSS